MQSQEKLALFSNPTFVHRYQCQCTSSPVGSSPSSSPRGPPPSLTSSPSPCSSSWWMVTLNYTVCNHFEREPGFDTGSKKTSILILLLKSYWSSPLMINITHFNTYLIFVIFFTLAKFLENKIYTEKRKFFALNL